MGQWLGRLVSRPSAGGGEVSGGAGGSPLLHGAAGADEDLPDLAQRVREVGEW